MDKKIRLADITKEKGSLRYMQTFPTDMANFCVAVKGRSATFADLVKKLKDQKQTKSARLTIGCDFLMKTTDSIRRGIKSAQMAYGYNELIEIKWVDWVAQEPNASIHREAIVQRQLIEKLFQNFLLWMEELLRALNKRPDDVHYLLEGCSSVMERLQTLTVEVIKKTYTFLLFISSQDLRFKNEQKRAKKEVEYYQRQFPFIFSDSQNEKGRSEKRKAEDESQSRPSSKPKTRG
jgi:hypothetical protein